MKQFTALLFLVLISGSLFAQNITNTLPSNGNFIVKDATNTFLTLRQSDGNVGIGTSTFDATNPEKLLIDCGTTESVNGLYVKGSINNYFQFNIRNLSTGNQSSSDIVATANNGTETTNFMDMGINGSNYVYTVGNPILTGTANDCYILASGQDLYIVNNNTTRDILFLAGGTDTSYQRMRIRGYNGNTTIGFSAYTNYKLAINGTCYAIQYWQASDSRLKHDIQPLGKSMENILKLRGVSFVYNNDSTGKTQIGFVAQELEAIYPELVITDDDGFKAVNYANMTAILLEGIKEQQTELDGLNNRLKVVEKSAGITQRAGFDFSDSNTGMWIFLSALVLSVALFIKRRNKQ